LAGQETGCKVTKAPIRLVIYDQEYNMRAELDADYIRQLGDYVDAKMRSIAARTQTVDSLRVAILAALNIADEYYQLRAKHEAAGEQLEKKLDACTEMIDEILKQET
jgi:cell division protein ZapA